MSWAVVSSTVNDVDVRGDDTKAQVSKGIAKREKMLNYPICCCEEIAVVGG